MFQAFKMPPGLTTPLGGLDSLCRTHLFFGLRSCLAAITSIPVAGTFRAVCWCWIASLRISGTYTLSSQKRKWRRDDLVCPACIKNAGKVFPRKVKILLHRDVCLSKAGLMEAFRGPPKRNKRNTGRHTHAPLNPPSPPSLSLSLSLIHYIYIYICRQTDRNIDRLDRPQNVTGHLPSPIEEAAVP